MDRLGYTNYYAQGGDIGGVIIAHMGALNQMQINNSNSNSNTKSTQKHVLKGIHLNFKSFLIPNIPMYLFTFVKSYVADHHYDMFVKSLDLVNVLNFGYLIQQVTFPATLA